MSCPSGSCWDAALAGARMALSRFGHTCCLRATLSHLISKAESTKAVSPPAGETAQQGAAWWPAPLRGPQPGSRVTLSKTTLCILGTADPSVRSPGSLPQLAGFGLEFRHTCFPLPQNSTLSPCCCCVTLVRPHFPTSGSHPVCPR